MASLEWGKIIVDVLKAIFWPGAFVWVAWYYRADIKALAVRVTELGMTKVAFAPPQQTPLPASPAPSTVPPELADKTATKPVAQGVKESIAAIRTAISPDQLDPQIAMVRSHLPPDIREHPDDTIDFLVHALASLSVQLGHERTYRLIYGTQLQLLLDLNAPGGLDKAKILSAFTAATTRFPMMYPSTTSFEQWMGFLINTGLVMTIASTGRYELTAIGRGFLRYILDNRLVPDRPY